MEAKQDSTRELSWRIPLPPLSQPPPIQSLSPPLTFSSRLLPSQSECISKRIRRNYLSRVLPPNNRHPTKPVPQGRAGTVTLRNPLEYLHCHHSHSLHRSSPSPPLTLSSRLLPSQSEFISKRIRCIYLPRVLPPNTRHPTKPVPQGRAGTVSELN